jgi:hypothetical protein
MGLRLGAIARSMWTSAFSYSPVKVYSAEVRVVGTLGAASRASITTHDSQPPECIKEPLRVRPTVNAGAARREADRVDAARWASPCSKVADERVVDARQLAA